MTSTARAQRRQPWRNPSGDRFGLLTLLLLAVLLLSGIDDQGWVRLVASMLNLGALVLVYSATKNHRGRWINAGAVIVALVGVFLVSALRADHLITGLGALIQVVILGTLVVSVIERVLEHETVSTDTLFGAIAAYLLIGQFFAWVYLALHSIASEAVLQPEQQGELPVYFSYVVLTTLGFGDITPVGSLTQRVAVSEALIGQLFIAVLLARLVSVYSRDAPSTDERATE